MNLKLMSGYDSQMRFRLGMVIGGAAGYVLGAKAGRQRYEDIRRWWNSARRNPSMEQVTDVTQSLSDLGRTVVAGGLEKVSASIRRPGSRESGATEVFASDPS